MPRFLPRSLLIAQAIAAISGVVLGSAVNGSHWVVWGWLAWLGLLLVCLGRHHWQGGVLAMLFAAGIGQAQRAQQFHLPMGLARQPVVLEGRVERAEEGMAATFKSRTPGVFKNVTFRVDRCRPLNQQLPGCHQLKRVRLTWQDAAGVYAGQRWQITARLKPSHRLQNPGLFPAHWSLLRQALGGTGTLLASPAPELLAPASHGLKYWLGLTIDHLLEEGTARRWAHGLLLGDASALTAADWQLLNDSGTTHLMVVSGMHIGVAMGTTLWLSRLVLRWMCPLHHRFSRWPWWLALTARLCYVQVSGSGPAAVRAFVMALAVAYAASGHYPMRLFCGWWLALECILMMDPLMLYRPGLWFSFLAVAALMIGWRWRPRQRGLASLLETQWKLGILLDGAVVLAFKRWMPISFVANLMAIPWVTMVLVPLGLGSLVAASLLPDALVAWGWRCFSLAVDVQAHCLAWLTARWPALPVAESMRLMLGLHLMAVGWLWLCPGFSLLFRAIITLVITLSWWIPHDDQRLATGELKVILYDIGQGQLMEVRTRNHRLLYDSGPRYLSGRAPLEALWPPHQHFDMFLLSHADSDHSGGVASLYRLHDVASTLAPLRESLRLPAAQASSIAFSECRKGQQWQWDGIDFSILWPPINAPLAANENDRSCVLMMTSGQHRVLVMGDASQRVERRLMATLDVPLDVVVSGHHGSNTSSSRQFLVRARPLHLLHTAGFMNPYRHPADAVVRRANGFGACQWNTALDGALTVTLASKGATVSRQSTRYAVEPACVGVSSPAK